MDIPDKEIDLESANKLKKPQKKIYRCAMCSFQTRHSGSVKAHQIVHLAPEERQMFACPHCDHKYRTKNGLTYHLECNHLNFRKKKVQIKTEKKVYPCSTCSYEAHQLGHLKQHEVVHLAPKEREMFPCPYCDNKYLRKYYLECHVKRSHTDSRNAGCTTSVTDKMISEDSLKIEIDDHAPLLDDFKNGEYLSMTNEVKSEDF
ncbi:zinc finger protein 425-like [Sitophilus oryzae]|uniref:Zinc finger protein 425-like n=1 Tax=Sitophilus oryzae TaxID=7048 RepID=A0A6J2X9X9_SITOR|nr:zinc finger protein 425-like [Sitophilus oryzae]